MINNAYADECVSNQFTGVACPEKRIKPKEMENLYRVGYGSLEFNIDCDLRSVIVFSYSLPIDLLNERSFTNNTSFKRECLQLSTDEYKGPYEKGLLVPHSLIQSSNLLSMVDILPIHKIANEGAWRGSEHVISKFDKVVVFGGPIWGYEKTSIFQKKHGVIVPVSFWKIAIGEMRGEFKVVAWIIPNDETGTMKNLSLFEVSVDDITKNTGFTFPDLY